MRRAALVRTETDDQGTFGKLSTGSFECYTAELPWRENARGLSCVPAGTYLFKWRKDRERYEEWDDPATEKKEDVPDRTHVQIHAANFAGDSTKGYKSQLLGCIAPGRAIGEIAGQKAVLSSRDALEGLVADLEKETFELVIKWAPGVGPKGAA